MKENSYRAALYMRLSKDDAGEGESASITTQRKLLRSYAKECGFFVYGEYVDDGWSGTSFDRPEWQRLLKDIEEKRINLVITKDLSRLGRDYIAAGQYTELYFPSKGVRYIAINDGYDSADSDNDMAPFRNVLNEMYARDISKKIKSAFSVKMKEGAFIGNFAPYGYQKDPADKNHLIVDEEAALVVREMFRLAQEGRAPAEIAETFNQKGILTPSGYKALKRGGKGEKGKWTSSMVCRMLGNRVYLGEIVQGKTTKISFKSKMVRYNPKEEWIAVAGMHDALISGEVFEQVQRRVVPRRRGGLDRTPNVFAEIARCRDCGHFMSLNLNRRSKEAGSLVCGSYKLCGSRACTNHFMDYGLLCGIIGKECMYLFSEKEQELCRRMEEGRGQIEKGFEGRSGEETVFQKRRLRLEQIMRQLYEDRAEQRISDESFYRLFSQYEAEKKDMEARHLLLDKGRERQEKELFGFFEGNALEESLKPWILKALVAKIEIGQGYYENGKRGGIKHQEIKIYYKCCKPEELS